jgi:hypothetical protein
MSKSKAQKPKRRLHLDRRAHQIIETCVGDPDELLDTRQLAEWLGVSLQWLEIGRSSAGGWGPPFTQAGPRAIRYRRRDVIRWLESRTIDPEERAGYRTSG